MTDQIHTREDVDVDEWLYQSRCPVCDSSDDTKCAGAVRPIIWVCDACDVSWTRETFNEIGDREWD